MGSATINPDCVSVLMGITEGCVKTSTVLIIVEGKAEGIAGWVIMIGIVSVSLTKYSAPTKISNILE